MFQSIKFKRAEDRGFNLSKSQFSDSQKNYKNDADGNRKQRPFCKMITSPTHSSWPCKHHYMRALQNDDPELVVPDDQGHPVMKNMVTQELVGRVPLTKSGTIGAPNN